MTRKSTDPFGGDHWTTVALRILNDNRERTIGRRFFGVASTLVFVTTVFHPANISFVVKLSMVVAIEAAIGLLAILMIKLERRTPRRLSDKSAA
ncbi:hypothetical protein GCM10011487_35130 [Steroidobacter agaridevorans]|uniref:Uncharacterized protein n=1 Tax=Steroidobacter agaridevorans TaxID=2695856 RepID=A0A829YF04_9GAMM|nr:hypothetical protein [Steroidobacter agaridevorans]GFE81513.1 hypothetical protein GCM10011487_35130 [Steroidobacter agaridevorans]GFE90258.1 hypothetical protein GCM10011488_52120 [Steroidobacter agaridevorans]